MAPPLPPSDAETDWPMPGPGAMSTNNGPAQTGGPGRPAGRITRAWAADRTPGQGHQVRPERQALTRPPSARATVIHRWGPGPRQPFPGRAARKVGTPPAWPEGAELTPGVQVPRRARWGGPAPSPNTGRWPGTSHPWPGLQGLAGPGPRSPGGPLPTRIRTPAKPELGPHLEVVQSHDVFMFQFLGQKPKFPVSGGAGLPHSLASPLLPPGAPRPPAHLEDLDFLAQQRLGLGQVLLVNALDRDLQVVLLKTQRGVFSRREPGTPRLQAAPGPGTDWRARAGRVPRPWSG